MKVLSVFNSACDLFLVENLQGPCKSAAFGLMIDKPELMSPLNIYTMKQCASRNTLAPPPITNNYSSAETKATSILKVQVQNDILEMIHPIHVLQHLAFPIFSKRFVAWINVLNEWSSKPFNIKNHEIIEIINEPRAHKNSLVPLLKKVNSNN